MNDIGYYTTNSLDEIRNKVFIELDYHQILEILDN